MTPLRKAVMALVVVAVMATGVIPAGALMQPVYVGSSLLAPPAPVGAAATAAAPALMSYGVTDPATGRVLYDSGVVPVGPIHVHVQAPRIMTKGNYGVPSWSGCYGSIQYWVIRWDPAWWPIPVKSYQWNSFTGQYCWYGGGMRGFVYNPQDFYGPIGAWAYATNIETLKFKCGGNGSNCIYNEHAEFGGPWYHAEWDHHAQGNIEECIFHYGCIWTYYPWINSQSWDDGEYWAQGAP